MREGRYDETHAGKILVGKATSIYAEMAELLLEAKTRITGRVSLHEVGTYSGDEAEDDPLNIALQPRRR